MPSTNSEKPIEFWWPHPDAFEDLTVEETEGGLITLSAPDDSEFGEWLEHWNQSPEHLELFTKKLIESLTNYADFILTNHVEN